ncbi:RNA polymerase I termination factor-like [Lotus japonicus]|uniref:RNA polymerase I termination factor-like n=1 Tax=Lotus japonicus TaxID=34305 RepID=UPI00258BAE91|nr:RNA polymerase I termination factor-like [Lotus japonicus]
MTEESDSQGNKLEKKKLHKKSKRPRDCETSNGGDDSVVTEERQGKKMKLDKVFSKEDGRTEDEDHDQGKKMKKKKKLSEETKPDDRGKEMKKNKKEKLIEESKSEEEYNKLRSNEGEDGDQGKKKKKNKKEKLIEESKSEEEYNQLRSNEGEDGDQGKKMKKKKKLSDKSKSKNSEFNSNEGEDNDRGKEMKKNKKKKSIEESKSEEEHNQLRSNEGEDGDQGKKMKKKKLSDKSKSKNSEFNSNDGGSSLASVEEGDAKACGDVTEVDDQSKKKKTKKKAKAGTDESTIPAAHGEKMKKKKLSDKSKSKISEFNSNEGDPSLASVEEGDAKACGDVTEVDDQSKKKKTKKKAKAGTDESTIPAAHGETSKPKRVTFSDQVEVYGDQVEVCGDQVEVCGDDDLVRGKRFTPEEDEKIKEAVSDYIESHGLGDEGLKMILHCMSHPEVRGCWKEIGEALPHRPHQSVYYRAHIIYERDEARKWTPEELDFLLKAQDQHGSDWKLIAEALNKHRLHVKDTWRRIRRTNANTGRWSQDEYQRLFDLVNKDLCARAAEDCRKNKHGMLRDNVSWEAISDEFGSRASALCCMKWYQQLTSPMVADGIWSDTDDYRLVNALYALDACSMEEVDWDNLLEHRSGDVCRKRWHQMVRNIREYAGKSFAEQVEILSKRYRPDLVEAREAFDSKPVVG